METFVEKRDFVDYKNISCYLFNEFNRYYSQCIVRRRNDSMVIADQSGIVITDFQTDVSVLELMTGEKPIGKHIVKNHLQFMALNFILKKKLFRYNHSMLRPVSFINLQPNCSAIISSLQTLMNLCSFNLILEIERNRQLTIGTNNLFSSYIYFRKDYKGFVRQWQRIMAFEEHSSEQSFEKSENRLNQYHLRFIIDSMGLNETIFPTDDSKLDGYNPVVFIGNLLSQLADECYRYRLFNAVDNLFTHNNTDEFVICLDCQYVDSGTSVQELLDTQINPFKYNFNEYLIVCFKNRSAKEIVIKDLNIIGNQYSLNSTIIQKQSSVRNHFVAIIKKNNIFYRLNDLKSSVGTNDITNDVTEDINILSVILIFEKQLLKFN